jgi:DNA invertase Pin-like site-specific DNA recombinase
MKKTAEKTKVVGYVRVSTQEQATSGHSLGSQRAKIVAYAALYDLELVEIVVDEGQSGKSLKRPGIERALAMMASGEVSAILVAKIDRLTRSLSDWQHLIRNYFSESAGGQLLSVSDSIDTRTATGRMVLNMLLTVAQWEREAIGERAACVASTIGFL